MSELTLDALAEKMRDIDYTMLITRTEGGELAGRPMSNNRDVRYDGESWFFTFERSRTVADIERDPRVALSLQGHEGLFGKTPLFVAVEGEAELIRDKAQFQAHWTEDLDHWFAQGADTPGVVLVHVRARRIRYWEGEDSGEFRL